MRSVTDDTLRGKEKYRLVSCPHLTDYGEGREGGVIPLVPNLGRWSKVLSLTLPPEKRALGTH
jgi:hypothetical protein